MPGALFTCEGLILGRRESGEYHWQLEVLSPEHGAVRALARRPSPKRPQTTVPDLYETVVLELEKATRSNALFIREARSEAPFSTIAGDYRAFLEAGSFTRTIWKNLVHAESFGELHTLTCQALQAFARRLRPEITHFKGLYLLARLEGYPVKEQMLASWSTADQKHAQQLITQPLDGEQPPAGIATALLDRLRQYLGAYTDIVIP